MPGSQAQDAGAPSASIALPILLLALIAGSQTMDPPIANIGLVEATKDLQIPAGAVSLAATIATLAASATVISSGFLADRLGRRRVLMVALALGIAGGVVAAASFAPGMYLAGRALAGIGLGAAFACSFAFVRDVAGPDGFASALGRWTAQLTLVALGGQLAGGVLINVVGWRPALLLAPTLCLIGLLTAPKLLPHIAPVKQGKPDYAGQLLLFLGVAGTLYGVANLANSFTSPRTLIPLLGGLASLAAFAVVELRLPNALFPIRLFTKRAFVAAVLIGMLWNFVDGGVVLQLSNLWQYVIGWGTESVSFGQLPLALAMIVGAGLVGRRLARGMPISRSFLIGTAAVILGALSLAFVRRDSGYLVFLPALLLVGAGIASLNVPSASLFVSQAPPGAYGVVTSSRLMVGQFGYSLATAVTTLLVNTFTEGGVTRRLEGAGVPVQQIGSAWDGVNSYVRFGGEQPATEAGRKALAVAAPSYVNAFIATMAIIAAITLVVGLVSVWLLRGHRAAHTERAPTDAVPVPTTAG